jgi:cell wall-associated NlpC family hydrolase
MTIVVPSAISQSPATSSTGATSANQADPRWRTIVRRAKHQAGNIMQIAGYGVIDLGKELNRRGQRWAPVASPDALVAPPQPNRESLVRYSRPLAVEWAQHHVDDSDEVHSDCCYFVSNALRAGGLPTTTTWQPGVTRSRVRRSRKIAAYPAYGCVGDFVIELLSSGVAIAIGCDARVDRIDAAEIGDVVIYNWDGRGTYQHAAIVTRQSDTTTYVTQHTPAQRSRPWNRKGNGTWIETALLLHLRTDEVIEP